VKRSLPTFCFLGMIWLALALHAALLLAVLLASIFVERTPPPPVSQLSALSSQLSAPGSAPRAILPAAPARASAAALFPARAVWGEREGPARPAQRCAAPTAPHRLQAGSYLSTPAAAGSRLHSGPGFMFPPVKLYGARHVAPTLPMAAGNFSA